MEGEISSLRSTVAEQMQQLTACKVCGAVRLQGSAGSAMSIRA